MPTFSGLHCGWSQLHTRLFSALISASLRCITPPLDEQEEIKESRLLEAQTRTELENEGCPPCYPPYLDIPLRNPPGRYQAIISYWTSFPGTGDVVLCAQLSNWQIFRAFQRKIRRCYRNKPFSNFVNKVRERRRRHALCGDVRLLLDLEQQSPLDNWIEFQNYHLYHLEKLDMRRHELMKELDDTQKKTGHISVASSELATIDTEGVQQELEYTAWDIERHKVLLQWIEEERVAMVTAHPTYTEENNDKDIRSHVVRRTSTRLRWKRRLEASAVLGTVRVSKAKSAKRNTQIHKPETPAPGLAILDLDGIAVNSIPKAPKYPAKPKPQRTQKQTPFCQLSQQWGSKAELLDDASVKSWAGIEPVHHRQAHPPDQAVTQGQLVPLGRPAKHEFFITRSGRISQPPVRWTPG